MAPFNILLGALASCYRFSRATKHAPVALGLRCIPLLFVVPAPGAIPAIDFSGNGLSIASWSLVGPFPAQKGDPWKVNFLSPEGSEAAIDTASSFERCVSELRNVPLAERGPFLDSLNVSQCEFVDFQYLFRRDYDPSATPSAAYAACIIQSRTSVNAYLLVGSADSAKVWLNGEALETYPARRGLATYQDCLRVHLEAGPNFLLIKVARWNNPTWGLVARLEPNAAGAASAALRGQGTLQAMLLKRVVIKKDMPLVLLPRGVPSDFRFNATVRDLSGNAVAHMLLGGVHDRWKPGEILPEGVYRLEIECDGDSYSELFCLGEPSRLAAKEDDELAKRKLSPKVRLDVEALQRRMQILFQAGASLESKNDRDLESKFVYTYAELQSLIDRVDRGDDAVAAAPGLHIRAFRSAIDNSVQHYRVFVPRNRRDAREPLPLVVILPTVTSASRPFIESPFIAAHAEAERLCTIAERYRLAILWCGYRMQPTGAPAEFTHFDECLAALGEDYNIDPHRIYLSGACSGGAIATMTAARWPERFAAIGLLNPEFHLAKKISMEEQQAFNSLSDFCEWSQHTSEVDAFLRLRKIPTYVVMEAPEPEHGDADYAEGLAVQARNLGKSMVVEVKPAGPAQHIGAWTDLFTWFASQRRPNYSTRRDERFFNSGNRLGAISDAFAQPFVVVRGTAGTEEDQKAIDKICAQFQAAWIDTHYNPCRVVDDAKCSRATAASNNLVLIGNEATNRLWKVALGENVLSAQLDSLRFEQHLWRGAGLSFQILARNALNNDKRAVFIGGADLRAAHLGPSNLSVSGWFNYAIWSDPGGGPQLVSAGCR